MGVPSGRLQFFALEATDYLERLALIVGRPVPPDADELVRLTRALRGAALMAGLAPFAQAAAALEQIAKAHRENPEQWGPGRAGVVSDAVEALKGLTRQAADWSDREATAATNLARELAATLGGETAPPTPPQETDELKPSVRAFVGREGALIAGTLEHAAQALELGQPAEAADIVLARLQPLRGLATLPSLSPLPEFLDAIELTVRSIREETSPPGGPLALRRAAAAVTRLAREIADAGRTADAPEVVLGAVSLLESFGSEDDVVEIATLFRTGDPVPIVQQGIVAPRDTSPDATIELVSLADRLRQAAEQLATPATVSGRTLYLYGLLVQLRPLNEAAPRERPHLAGLLDAISRAIGAGRAGRAPLEFSAALREAAEKVTQAAGARNAVFLGDELEDVIAQLSRLGPSGPAAAAKAAEDLERDVVPIESLAPDAASFELPPSSVLPRPEPTVERPSVFETSFSSYHQLITTARERPAPTTAAVDVDQDAVSIDSLLLRGRRALERADIVRLELSVALRNHSPFDAIEPLVSELIDLVPLALEE